MDVGVVRNRAGGICRERSGFAAIAQRFIKQVRTLAARPLRVGNYFLTEATGEVGAKFVLAAFTIVEELGIKIFAGTEAAFDQNADMLVGAINRRVEAGQIRVCVDRAWPYQCRSHRHRQCAAPADPLCFQHEGTEAVFAQHRGIGGERLYDGATFEKVSRVEAECSATAQIDATKIQIDSIVRLPTQEAFTEIVDDVFVVGQREVILSTKVETIAKA